mmetsp:Transcript_29330/g.86898  ORF Transcript_29330/g.86898 Transcript_29330/m.86898 type:complete len:213 (-) Transcript_29330:1990-2628(-)
MRRTRRTRRRRSSSKGASQTARMKALVNPKRARMEAVTTTKPPPPEVRRQGTRKERRSPWSSSRRRRAEMIRTASCPEALPSDPETPKKRRSTKAAMAMLLLKVSRGQRKKTASSDNYRRLVKTKAPSNTNGRRTKTNTKKNRAPSNSCRRLARLEAPSNTKRLRAKMKIKKKKRRTGHRRTATLKKPSWSPKRPRMNNEKAIGATSLSLWR